MNEQDQRMEREVRAAVWQQASTMPPDASLPELAVSLVDSMGARSDEQKATLLAITYVTALKMLVELVPDPEQQT